MEIMFVDDEPALLEGLENRLRRMRKQWAMSFVEGSEAAVKQLAEKHFDVIVTDMRMPGMDGEALLRHVREHYPHMVRIVLTGQTEKEKLLNSLRVAHQILNKPTDLETLKGTIERANALQHVINEGARCSITKLKNLPSVPRLYRAVTDLLATDEPNIEAIAELIEQDPAMTARILQIVNSSFFGLNREIVSARDAVTYLGLEVLPSIVLATEIMLSVGVQNDASFSLEKMQTQAFEVAQIAAKLLDDDTQAKTAFAAGMLHDIGQLVMACSLPEEYQQVREHARANHQGFHQSEFELLQFNHAEIAAHILSLWDLPRGIIEAVAYHHYPEQSGETEFGPVTAVYVADYMTRRDLDWSDLDQATAEIKHAHLQALGVDGEIANWRLLAEEIQGELHG